MADDAGGAGNEEDFLSWQQGERGARKGRAARTVVGRVEVGADLAGIFHRQRRRHSGEEGDRERPAGEADGAGGRYIPGRAAVAGEKGILAADVELAITLQPVRDGVDVCQVVPDPPQVRQALRVEQAEDAPVGFGAGRLQRRTGGIAGERRLLELEHPVEQIACPPPGDPLAAAGGEGGRCPPGFRDDGCGRPGQGGGNALHRPVRMPRAGAGAEQGATEFAAGFSGGRGPRGDELQRH
jgi:hypothetical protein